jgi:hypothetical protein
MRVTKSAGFCTEVNRRAMQEQTVLGRCMLCDKPITHSWVVCAGCQTRFGLGKNVRLWPDWARKLNTLHTAQRRAERDMIAHIVDIGRGRTIYDRRCYGEKGED